MTNTNEGRESSTTKSKNKKSTKSKREPLFKHRTPFAAGFRVTKVDNFTEELLSVLSKTVGFQQIVFSHFSRLLCSSDKKHCTWFVLFSDDREISSRSFGAVYRQMHFSVSGKHKQIADFNENSNCRDNKIVRIFYPDRSNPTK